MDAVDGAVEDFEVVVLFAHDRPGLGVLLVDEVRVGHFDVALGAVVPPRRREVRLFVVVDLTLGLLAPDRLPGRRQMPPRRRHEAPALLELPVVDVGERRPVPLDVLDRQLQILQLAFRALDLARQPLLHLLELTVTRRVRVPQQIIELLHALQDALQLPGLWGAVGQQSSLASRKASKEKRGTHQLVLHDVERILRRRRHEGCLQMGLLRRTHPSTGPSDTE
mmetsp:Transcript_11484/g.37739  ORF Transcript_11484/g.37739 Transcript_11484/m.37739 type:complete len:223 (+) Transcript_11484:507-1175(+)